MWFIIFFFPILPLGSYRVTKEKQKFFTGGFPRYQMTHVNLNWRQIIYTYLAWWCTLIALIFAFVVGLTALHPFAG
jgi:hypothetical protein